MAKSERLYRFQNESSLSLRFSVACFILSVVDVSVLTFRCCALEQEISFDALL